MSLCQLRLCLRIIKRPFFLLSSKLRATVGLLKRRHAMPIGPIGQDEPLEIQLEFDGEKHGTIDIFWGMAQKHNLHEYLIVPIVEYNKDLKELTVIDYSFIHVKNVGRYLKKLEEYSTPSSK